MRKALIGLLITATAVTPLASAAAQSRSSRDEQRVERAERQVQRAQRQERRADRTERRTDRRVEQAVRQDDDRQVERAVRQERRADRVESRTDARVDRAERRLDRAERQQTRSWDGSRDRQIATQGTRSWDRNRSTSSSSWNHDWRNDRRYDWRRYRSSNRHLYNLGRYYSPYRHHRYSRFSIGFFLEPLFFSQRYWISDPWYYRLPPAYPGTRWVRYYDDVLLIDMYSGEVIDVIYDFFW